MKKIALIALVKKLLLLIILLLSHAYADSPRVYTSNLLSQFPNAEHEGISYYFRLDDCNIVALENTYSSTTEIALIFVQSKQRSKTLATAQRLVKLFPAISKNDIVPFAGDPGSVVIFCPVGPVYTKGPLRILLTPSGVCKTTTQFVGWQGKCIKARVDLEKLSSFYSSSSSYSSSRKKMKGIVEMIVDLSESRVTTAEFNIVKGRIDLTDMQDFITTRMNSFTSTSFSTSSLSAKAKKDLKKLYSNYDIVSYSSSYDFCIATKSKQFYAGTLEDVKKIVAGTKKSDLAFNFENKVLNWPGESPKENNNNNNSNELVSSSAGIDYNVFNKQLLPGAGVYEGNLTYFRLDDSRIIVPYTTWEPKQGKQATPQNDITMIFVTSFKNKEDAHDTALHLAKLIPGICTLKAFEGSDPTYAIYMPKVPSLDYDKNSTSLKLLLYPRNNYEKNVRFMGWKDGLLISRVTSTSEGANGEVEIILDPAGSLYHTVVEFHVLKGNVNMRRFLFEGRINTEEVVTPQEEPSKYDKGLIAQWVSSCGKLLLISLGNNTYRLGTLENLMKTQQGNFNVRTRGLLKTPRPWPDGPTRKSETTPEGQNTAQQADTHDSTGEQQIVNITEESADENYGTTQTTAPQKESNILSPEQAYKDYLESLKKM